MAVPEPTLVQVAPGAGGTGVTSDPTQRGLWVGSTAAPSSSHPSGTTRILTLNGSPPPTPAIGSPAPTTLTLEIQDDIESDLLSLLPRAVEFLEGAGEVQGASAGAIAGDAPAALVLCSQGVSRSVAVAVAALMKRQGEADPAPVLEAVRKAHPAGSPNEGFLEQLSVWGASGFRANPRHPAARSWRLARAARALGAPRGSAAGGASPIDPDLLADPLHGGDASSAPPETIYRCRSCRFTLASDLSRIEGGRGAGARAFGWRKRDAAQRRATEYGTPPGADAASSVLPPDAGSVFVEPLVWMRHELEQGLPSGKLHCPCCGARLGSYSWSGTQDHSGQWIVPAFQLHASRLDAVPAPTAAAGAGAVSGPAAASTTPGGLGIRQPRVLGGGPRGLPASRPAVQRPVRVVAGAGSSAATPSDVASEATGAPSAAPSATACGAAGATSTAPSSAAGGAAGAAAAAPESALTGLTPLPESFTHLVLDCDGVMVDSERASCESMRRAIAHVSGGFLIPGSFPEDYYPVFGMNLKSCLEYYQGQYPEVAAAGQISSVLPVMTARKEELYQELTASGIAAFEGIRELVAAAKAAGLGVAIASSGNPDKIQRNLSSSGLLDIVPPELTVSAAYVAAGKPAPDVYIEALRRLGCDDPSRALVVEDAVMGVKAAKGAGCFAVAITNTLPRHVLLAHADAVVDHADDVRAFLLRGR